jgi:ATP-binding cassette subfamily B protein
MAVRERSIMKLLFRYLLPQWSLLLRLVALATASKGFTLVSLYWLKRLIDERIVKYAMLVNYSIIWPYLREILPYISFVLGAEMLSRITLAGQSYYVNILTKRVGVNLYADGLRHALNLPYQAFEDNSSGEVLSRLQKARTTVEKLVTALVNALFATAISIAFVTWYASTVYWPIMLLYLLVLPLLGLLISFASKGRGRTYKAFGDATDALAGSTAESLRNIELVKSLGLVQQEVGRLKNATENILKLEGRISRYMISISFVAETFLSVLRISLLLFMLGLIIWRRITLGNFILFSAYSALVFDQIQKLVDFTNLYHEAKSSLFKLQEILDKLPIVKNKYTLPVLPLETLAFDAVSFKHLAVNITTLNNISFTVRTGETIAFVGPSGAGKTTLIKLLLGLYPPLSGQIYYNGIPKDEVDFEEVRAQTGLVSQDTQLFSGTIIQNLRFVAPDATEDECLDALHWAAADGFSLDSKIGEGGLNLSGGERQRLSIARALLRHPALLIFDEATSALDSIMEAEIGKSIREISIAKQYITIVIAHRLSTVVHADKIFVLDRGEIVEEGKHEKLLDQKGLYHAMWRQQTGA